ncbi:MAG: LysR family transcriptional regulator [Pseudonocardia sp. SCN 72-86]|nr:MAG: LysR family transcriptional regulator [Pseudonocardia sp. SCN 72-86]
MVLSARVPDIGALDLLLSVARLGSLGRAAHEHGISQPAAGSRIRHLEGLIGLSLIERSPSGSRLTAEGVAVVDWAREIVRAVETLDNGVRALRAGHATRLRIAASLTIADYLLPSWLADLRTRRPDAAVQLRVVNSTEVVRLIHAGQVELGFVEGPELAPGLESQVLGHDRLVVVVAPEHKWARRRRSISIGELAATSLVQREPGSGTRDTVELVLGRQLGGARPVVELSSTTAIKAAVAAGVGPAVLSSLAVADELERDILVAVEIDQVDMIRELRAVWSAGRRLGAEYQDVLSVAARHS